ncbi:hypothetical protein [Hymenobacter arcticus]
MLSANGEKAFLLYIEVKKVFAIVGPATVMAVAIYAGLLDSKPAFAQTARCAPDSQTCYQVYVSAVKVRTVSGVAQIRL